jgi:molybdopterin/thiamine biosynthesis adenylyltransferase
MTGDLRILPEQYETFAAEMLAAAPLESVAACTAGWWSGDDGEIHLLWRSSRIAGDGDYLRRGLVGAAVKPEFLAPIVKRCRQSGEALILAHTHPFTAVPAFSGIDDGGEDILIPKVRDRAPDAPHGGLVLGQRGASARAWLTNRGATPITLKVIGNVMDGPRSAPEYARQDMALGPGTAALLGTMTVAVVGTGGLGWDIATLLSAHGIGKIVLIDDDGIEAHNRPRLRGSKPSDVGRRKVTGLADLLRGSRPEGIVIAIPERLEAVAARDAAAKADLIITATDNLLSRFDADRFARQLMIPLVDAGINIQVVDDRLHRIGGRVSVSYPDGGCLSCMGILAPDALAAESDPLGYRGQGRLAEASVAAYNAVLAGLAITDALALLLPLGLPRRSRHRVYDGIEARVREVAVPPAGSCGTCGDLTGNLTGSRP